MDKINQTVTYEYQVLRYRPDAVSGEFVNVGLIYFDPSSRLLKTEVLEKYKRISHFFHDVPGTFLMRSLKQLRNKAQRLAKQMEGELDFDRFNAVAAITASLLPKDDNGLFFSETFRGWHLDHEISFKELYHRIVEQYIGPSVDRHDDTYAWKKVYKKYFDEYGITPKLKQHKVKTALTEIDFDKTVQNGALHCFQSLSFDLKHNSSIEDKIFRWDGRIRELATSTEELKVYLLSVMPKDKKLAHMIQEKLNYTGGGVEVKVVNEKEARSVAREVNKVLEDH